MDLESLANELFLDLFEYFSSVDLLQAFYNLNTRLNNLIYLHFQTHILNFQSTSKSDFDLICQKYLPSLTDRIISLRLSDDDDTPQEINLFFSYNFSLQQFSSLQSLSIYRIYSFNLLERILNELPYLSNLIHLKINRYHILYNEIYDIGIINLIERLSNLISCHLDITNDNDQCIETLSIICLSLKDLSIPHLSCNLNHLFNLIKYLSNLQSLNIRIVDHLSISNVSSMKFLSIKKLQLVFYGSLNSLNNLFQTMSNIEELKLNMPSTYIDGYDWKTIIENNLSHLIIFQLKMSISLSSNQKNKEEKIDKILNSFQSYFWIKKHQWFIQCYYNLTDTSSIIYVYTLPYAFQNFLYISNGQLKSTCSHDQHYSFNSIHNLYYSYVSSQNLFSSDDIRLNNIRYLDLTIPFDESFWLIISRFDRITSLNIVLNSDMNLNDIQFKLQNLIDRLFHLYSLAFFSWTYQNIFPFQIKNSSIRQLDLRSPNLIYNYHQCLELTHSSIGKQCQILFINLQQRTDIIYLINHMNNLRALIIKCSNQLQTTENNDNLIQWLEQHLPTTCIIPNPKETDDNIRLWIG